MTSVPKYTTRNQPLEKVVQQASPSWVAGNLGAVGVDLIPVQLTPSGVNIHLGSSEPALTLPSITASPEEHDNGKGKI